MLKLPPMLVKDGLINRIDSLIERYTVEAGGVQIAQGFNGYNVFRHLKDNLTCEHLDATTGHTEVCRSKSYVTGAAISTTKLIVQAAGLLNSVLTTGKECLAQCLRL